MKIAVLGNVTLDFFAQDFRRAGHDVYLAPGFDAWRAEVLDAASGLHAFQPEAILLVLENVETREAVDLLRNRFPRTCVVAPPLDRLADETPGFWDARMRQLAAMPFSLRGIQVIEEEFFFAVETAKTRLPLPKKILALDADNTLWRGIISEDGADRVVPFTAFQEGILALRAKGVLLVLLSKNDPPAPDAPVVQAFARTDMPLALDAFAQVCVAWSPKAGNLLTACQALNLGVDSVVFVDDNPVERLQMQTHLPAVAVPPFPADLAHPATFLRRLEETYFAGVGATDEDRARAAMYAQEAARRDAAAAAATLDGYLASLKLVCRPSRATAADIPRLAQMAGKTNQFNATTIRRTAEDFAALLADPAWRVWVFRVTDAYGEMGLVCYVIARPAEGRITDFVMSCRAMGRTIEQFAFNHVRAELAQEGACLAAIDCVPTPKNGPFRAFYNTLDFAAQAPLQTHVRGQV